MRRKIPGRCLAAALAASMCVCLGGCGSSDGSSGGSSGGASDAGQTELQQQDETKTETAVSLQFWTYPVGRFGDEDSVQELIKDFSTVHPGIDISVRHLDYGTGDQEISEAVKNGEAPDLVFEGPERIVANWGASGLMASLDDLWENEDASGIYIKVASACRSLDGVYYEYPLSMLVHTMAINKDVFEKAGAMQYVDEETGCWSSDDFISAAEKVHAYLTEQGDKEGRVATVYCKDQGGDQGTRALMTNLYSGQFTNEYHTEYMVDSPENQKALLALSELEYNGIVFDKEKNGGDDIEAFCSGSQPMTFCWNSVTQKANEDSEFEILPVTFPSDDSVPELCGGIYGFGVFDNQDEAKVEAAKEFIRFLTADVEEYKKAVLLSNGFPVLDSMNGEDLTTLYKDDVSMNLFMPFMQYFGDYYQVTPGWPAAREAWWEMLQKIDDGEAVDKAAQEFTDKAEKAAEEMRESL